MPRHFTSSSRSSFFTLLGLMPYCAASKCLAIPVLKAQTIAAMSCSLNRAHLLEVSSTEIFKPFAINATTILLGETNAATDADTTWLQRLDQTAPTKIADGRGVNSWMSSRYAVWDDPHTGYTTLFDLTTGQMNPTFAPCIRPAIADAEPYLVCVNFNTGSYLLVHVPDGAQTVFESHLFTGADGGQMYNGRVFFIGPNGSVEYFDLPDQ